MKEQIFELVPPESRLIAQVDLLRYENAYLSKRVEALERKLAEMEGELAARNDRLQDLQYALDVITAERVGERS